jgi:hypothetical protein
LAVSAVPVAGVDVVVCAVVVAVLLVKILSRKAHTLPAPRPSTSTAAIGHSTLAPDERFSCESSTDGRAAGCSGGAAAACAATAALGAGVCVARTAGTGVAGRTMGAGVFMPITVCALVDICGVAATPAPPLTSGWRIRSAASSWHDW